ncbi:MAG: hypothetical protein ACK2UV_01000 [Candidatus Promineifilaceae bacterium]
MNNYFPPDAPIPIGYKTPRLLLEALRPEHVQLDYDAVMESRDYLRLWSGSSWPADDFTLADNLQDLQWHWREHQERAAFTYTVLNPARESCLGCVYMRPLSELIPYNTQKLQDVAADESLVRFWVRTSKQSGDLERHLLQTLIRWLHEEWPFSRILFETSAKNDAQVALFETYPLQRAMSLEMPQRGGIHLFYLVSGEFSGLSISPAVRI